MHAPIEDVFSLVPEVLTRQAFYSDIAEFPTPQGLIRLAVWARLAYVEPADGALIRGDGKCNGVQVVAYYCDPDGTVYDWEKRYEVETSTDGTEAIRKLRALLANDLAKLWNYEGLLDFLQKERDKSCGIDWEQMPASLQ